MTYSIDDIKHMLEPFAPAWTMMSPRQFIFNVQQTVLNILAEDDLTDSERIGISIEVADWMVKKGEEYASKGNDNGGTGSSEEHT